VAGFSPLFFSIPLPASEPGGGLGAGAGPVDGLGAIREGAAGAVTLGLPFELSALQPTLSKPPIAKIARSFFTVGRLS
jgi:hypothetical protein